MVKGNNLFMRSILSMSAFVIVLCLWLFSLVDRHSGEFVVLVICLVLNLALSARVIINIKTYKKKQI